MTDTTIPIKSDVRDRLRAKKIGGESYSDAIERLMARRGECYECGVQLHRNGPNAVIEGREYCETCGDAELRAQEDMAALSEDDDA